MLQARKLQVSSVNGQSMLGVQQLVYLNRLSQHTWPPLQRPHPEFENDENDQDEDIATETANAKARAKAIREAKAKVTVTIPTRQTMAKTMLETLNRHSLSTRYVAMIFSVRTIGVDEFLADICPFIKCPHPLKADQYNHAQL